MKTFKKVLSYILVAAITSGLTLGVYVLFFQPRSKLEAVQDLIQERFIGEVDQTAMEDAAAYAMVDSLGDRWSGYLSAADYAAYREQMHNAYVGIGITIAVREDNTGFDITKVEPNGPAEEAGLLVGDILIRAEGQEVAALGTSGARQIILGKEGTDVEVTVLRDGEELTFSVTRRTIETAVATAEMLEDNIALITIVNFNDRCAQQTIALIGDMLAQGAEGIVFDVRFNPGGYAHELVDTLDHLLPEGPLFRTLDYAGNEDVEYSDENYLDIPMAVLVNRDSYSAAEFFAAALREYDAAVVVGQQTCGKGYFQQTYAMTDGSAVSISIGKYFTPNGVSLADAGGLVPDIPVEVDEQTAAKLYAGILPHEEDPQLQAAVDALKAG